MVNEAKMTELIQSEDMVYFRADLCCYSHAEPLRGSRACVCHSGTSTSHCSPESYSLEEGKEIFNDMMSTSKVMLGATHDDFVQLTRMRVPSF